MEFVKPSLKWKKKFIPFVSLTWSGTDTQASRLIEFDLAWNPYDKGFTRWNIKKGDVVELWFDGSDHAWFVGTITAREKTDEIGTAHYVAKDFMHHLLNSTGTYIFKNTTPEAITKKICSDVEVKTKGLFKTGVNIKKMIFESQSLYDIIVKAYRKVKAETKKNYLPVMLESKVTVLEKGNFSGVTLTQGVNIISATYADNVDNMVDLVRIFNDKHKKVGEVKNEKQMSTYGVYMQAYQKENGVNAKKAAQAMLYGTTREASVEALGDIRAMSGFSIKIKDPATGLSGKFFITSDSHTFSNNIHTMTLDLAWNDSMEEGADTWKKSEVQSGTSGSGSASIGGGYSMPSTPSVPQMPQTNKSYAYYIDGMRTGPSTCFEVSYHSNDGCVLLKQEKEKNHTTNVHKITVAQMKKKKDFQGRVIKPCAACWSGGKANVVVPGSLAATDPRYQAAQKSAINTEHDSGYAKQGTHSAISSRTDPRYMYIDSNGRKYRA